VFTKSHILDEIKRTAVENNGSPLGRARFEAETGIKDSDWIGIFWARWSDALIEAGFEPNAFQGARDEDELLECLSRLARDLGHFPVANEIKLRARTEPGFPWHNTFSRLGRKHDLAIRLREFALSQDDGEVAAYCDEVISSHRGHESSSTIKVNHGPASEHGYVYMLKSGRFFKIGRSNAVGRREHELAIQLPEKAKIVHSIKTDDPVGIENYWHNRFSDRRMNGEWFDLSAIDVAAFKRRKFM
jgi:hypothetical protein